MVKYYFIIFNSLKINLCLRNLIISIYFTLTAFEWVHLRSSMRLACKFYLRIVRLTLATE